MAGQLRVDEITDEAGTGSPSFPVGNVGIGTSSPYKKLTIRGTSDELMFDLNSTSNGVGAAIVWNGSTADLGANPSVRLQGIREGAGAAGALIVSTRDGGTGNTNERLRINAAGNVGIGTSSPGDLLHVAGFLRSNSYRPGLEATKTSVGSTATDIVKINADAGGFTNYIIEVYAFSAGNNSPCKGTIVARGFSGGWSNAFISIIQDSSTPRVTLSIRTDGDTLFVRAAQTNSSNVTVSVVPIRNSLTVTAA